MRPACCILFFLAVKIKLVEELDDSLNKYDGIVLLRSSKSGVVGKKIFVNLSLITERVCSVFCYNNKTGTIRLRVG